MKKREDKNVLLPFRTAFREQPNSNSPWIVRYMPPFFPPLPRRKKVVFYSTPLNVTALRQSACRSSPMRLNPKCAEREKKQSNKLDREVGFFFFGISGRKKGSRKKVEEPLQQLPGFFFKSGRTVFKKRKKAGNRKSRKTVPKSCPTWP